VVAAVDFAVEVEGVARVEMASEAVRTEVPKLVGPVLAMMSSRHTGPG
jgi:hypothetical protein